VIGGDRRPKCPPSILCAREPYGFRVTLSGYVWFAWVREDKKIMKTCVDSDQAALQLRGSKTQANWGGKLRPSRRGAASWVGLLSLGIQIQAKAKEPWLAVSVSCLVRAPKMQLFLWKAGWVFFLCTDDMYCSPYNYTVRRVSFTCC
jgi:hypothetical protein